MGDLQVFPPLLKGIDGVTAGYISPSSHPPNPNPPAIGATVWRKAELATQEIIERIQPTVVSEQRRRAVVEYVQKLIRGFVSSEVFPFGSVPLKTYLPDGDIDLTAISIPSSEDALASDVRTILEGEEHNNDSDFEVKDVQYIQAEVKLVKCLVQNIVVDISFNQIGGLCTLCFLEQVDRFIGKDHLFKRSIILIKAWCYYESRILGAHHGLISTYALETLVLYIFHLFHSSLDGPLAVLYRFLDYYSKFDWDKYCISLRGPVSLSSLPELAVEAVDNDGGDLLLTEEFLRSCVHSFSVPIRGSENNSRIFMKKYLNIVDPLRESNNLGRSVSKGNFYRIRSAFTFGARKLERLLVLPVECIAEEVRTFFMNTMSRHGGGERPDVQDLVLKSLGCAPVESNGVSFGASVDKLEKEHEFKSSSESLAAKNNRDLNDEMKNIQISVLDDAEGRIPLQKSKSFSHKQQNSTKMEPSVEVIGVSSGRLVGDAKDLATVRCSASGSLTESSKASTSSKEDFVLDFRKAYHAPHLAFQANNVPLTGDLNPSEEISSSEQTDSSETDSSLNGACRLSDFGIPSSSQQYSANYGPQENGTDGPSASLSEMSDLSGEYEMHLSSLNYALWCQEQIVSTYFLPIHRPPHYSFYHHGKDVWARGSTFSPMNSNALSPRPPFSPAARYSMNQPFISSSFNAEDAPKTRGTGTYFPNTNYHVYRERHSPGRVKPVSHMPRPQNNGHADLLQGTGSGEKGFHEPGLHAQPVFGGNGRGRFLARLDIPHWSSRPAFKPPANNANGILLSPEFGGLEFGSLGPVPPHEPPTREHGRRLDSTISHTQPCGVTSPASSSQRSSMNSNRDRTLRSTYQLKDEEDFPPLSS